MNFCVKILLLLFVSIPWHLWAAQEPDFKSAAWQEITQLKDQTKAHLFAVEKIKQHCKEDYTCQKEFASYLVEKFGGQNFDLRSAVHLNKYILEKATAKRDISTIIAIHRSLVIFYDALGERLLAAEHDLKERQMRTILGQKEKTPVEKFYELIQNLSGGYDETTVLKSMDSLYKATIALKDTQSLRTIRFPYLDIKISRNDFEGALEIIRAFEEIPIHSPIRQNEYPIVITTHRGRGEIAFKQKKYDEAFEYFKKALEYSQQEPGPWMVIYNHIRLYEVEVERGNFVQAVNYLELAYELAKKREIQEFIIETSEHLAKQAEKEGNYKDAYFYKIEKADAEIILLERKADFDIKNFRLETERNQLLQTKTQLEQEAKIKNFRTIILVLGLFSLAIISALLALTYYRQKKATRALKRKNEIIEAQKNDLLVLDEAKTKFFTNVSHALRTPLTLIKGPIEKLKSRNILDDERQLMTVIASKNVKHLENIISEILDLTKIDAGKMTVEMESVNLHFFLASYLSQFDSLGYTNNISYSYHLHLNESVVGKLDTFKVKRILYNLLTNAFKFTNKDGFIKVDTFMGETSLEITVHNTGHLIPKEDIPLLFDRYFQSSNTHHTNNGTGVGLSIVKEYIDLMHGKVTVSSTQDPRQDYAKTVFKVVLPVELSYAAHQKPSLTVDKDDFIEVMPLPIVKNRSINHSDSILLVEDNDELILFLKLMLSPHFTVFSAKNGQLALDFLAESPPPNAIISDIMMPVMDGFTFIENIKSNPLLRHIPVVMLTARASTEDKTRALRIGIDTYLVKPFDESELMATLKRLFKNQAERSAYQAENTQTYNIPALAEEDQEWLKRFEQFVSDNLNNDQLSLDFIAESMDISISTLTRQCKQCVGLTPAKYITYVRIEKAYQLLNAHQNGSITKIAEQVGYSDLRSFNRNFKAAYGKDPAEYLE